MASKDELYRKFFETYKCCHKDKKPADCQKDVNIMWNNFKAEYKDFNDFCDAVNNEIQKLNQKFNKSKARLTFFFSKVMFSLKFIIMVHIFIF